MGPRCWKLWKTGFCSACCVLEMLSVPLLATSAPMWEFTVGHFLQNWMGSKPPWRYCMDYGRYEMGMQGSVKRSRITAGRGEIRSYPPVKADSQWWWIKEYVRLNPFATGKALFGSVCRFFITEFEVFGYRSSIQNYGCLNFDLRSITVANKVVKILIQAWI